MQIVIINDCSDQNAKLRQVARVGSLFKNSSVSCFGVKSEFEMAGSIVDAIDAFDRREGVIIANISPRNNKIKKRKNGSPFGFFWHKKTLVIFSIDGFALSLVKKLEITKNFNVIDIDKTLNILEKNLDNQKKLQITNSQFRSFDFLPKAAYWIFENEKISFQEQDILSVSNIPETIWFIDNFGNAKTTLLKNELNLRKNGKTKLKIKDKVINFDFYDKLVDLPCKSAGLVLGSSGIEDKRFIEIMIKGDNAADKMKLETGFEIKVI